MKTAIKITAAVLGLAVLVGLWVARPQLKKWLFPDEEKPELPTLVRVEPAGTDEISEVATFVSVVEARARARIYASHGGGRIEEVHVDVGERVRTGQILARLEHDEQDARLAEAEAAHEEAKATKIVVSLR